MEATSGRLMSRQIARFLEQLKSDLLHSCGGDHNDPHVYTIGYLIGALQEEEDVQKLRCEQQHRWPPDLPIERIASLTAQVILEDRAARRSERQPILEDENFEFGGRGGKLYETDEDARTRVRMKKCFIRAWRRHIKGEQVTVEECLWTEEDDFLWKLKSHRGHTTTNAVESFSRVG